MLLYHLVPQAKWEACKSTGEAYYPETYAQDGFTHMSDNSDVLIAIGNTFYTDVEGNFIVLEVEKEKLGDPVKWEEAAPVGDKKADFDGSEAMKFPHLVSVQVASTSSSRHLVPSEPIGN